MKAPSMWKEQCEGGWTRAKVTSAAACAGVQRGAVFRSQAQTSSAVYASGAPVGEEGDPAGLGWGLGACLCDKLPGMAVLLVCHVRLRAARR